MARYRAVIAAVVFVGLLAWVLTNERGRARQEGEVFGFDPKYVSMVDITQNKTDKLTLERNGDEWWIKAPIAALCDKDKIDALLQNIVSLKPKSRSGVDLNSDDFGLKDPLMVLTFTGKGTTYTLSLGKDLGIGSETYAKLTGMGGWDSKLLLVPTSFKTELFKKPEDLRDKKLVRYDKEKVAGITLEQEGQPRIVATCGKIADKNEWKLTEPIQAKGDEISLSGLAGKPTESDALGFKPVPQNLADVGLDKPQVKLTVAVQDGKSYTILLGKTAQEDVSAAPPPSGPGGPPPVPTTGKRDIVYAMREGRPEVLLMDATLLTDLQKDLMAVRDKHIVTVKRDAVAEVSVQRAVGLTYTAQKRAGKWQVSVPKSGDAKEGKIDNLLWDIEDLQATKFVDEAPKDLKGYGLANPQTVINLKLSGVNEPLKISFGYPVDTDKKSYYCQVTGSPQVYEVSSLILDDMPKAAEDIVESPGAAPSGMPTPPPGGVQTAPPMPAPGKK